MEPYEIFMLILLIVMEVPAAVILTLAWVRAWKDVKRDG